MSTRLVTIAAAFLTLSAGQGPLRAQEAEEEKSPDSTWNVTLARGQTRTIDFVTEEGTFISLDVSPDGQWIVFDLLAHIYRVPIGGGEAECLTQDSGVATNYHPSYSPDGRHIAFVSDREGQNNLWVMDADGSNPRQVRQDLNSRVIQPRWSADGDYIIVRKNALPRPGGPPPRSGLWMYHRDGGEGVQLTGRDQRGADWPSPSGDGKYVYFQVDDASGPASGQNNALAGAIQVRRLELETGDVMAVSAGAHAQQVRSSSGGMAAPEVSPDGARLAFIRRMPDGRISYKGHEFGPRTALWLRDLADGSERLIMDPVEQDMIEGMKVLRIFPGYDWTPDGRSIVLSQGGRIRKVDVDSGEIETIPFTARVRREISEQAYQAFRITDEPFRARFLRWPAASPDGSRLVFQAVGKLWTQELPDGTPRRLTADSFDPFEFSPAWSPDGRWIAFTSWDESERGALWKVAASGGEPQRLSESSGEFVHPDWSADGSEIVVARGANATARGRNLTNNPWFDLVRLPSGGGAATPVARVDRGSGFGGQRSQLPQPFYGPDGRIFFLGPVPEAEDGDGGGQRRFSSQLMSVRPDGSDERVHALFENSDHAAISPDGRHVAFVEGDNVYLSPMPYAGAGGQPVEIVKQRGTLPVQRLSTNGGLFPNWRRDGVVEFGSGPFYSSHDVAADETTTSEITLMVPRDIPSGSVALRGARIVTLDGEEVIEGGDIVVTGSRITCVGRCPERADREIDVSGTTIVPGFVDMHAHHYREYNGIIPAHAYEAAIYLAYGVTSNLDNSMWNQNVFPTAELIDAGKVIGPRTYSTSDPLYNRDSARQNLLTSYEAAEQDIRRLKSWGGVSVKQYLQPRRDQRQWVSDIARKEGLMVTSEGSDLAYNLSMIMDGQTAFEHPMSYMPLYSDAAKFFGMAKAVYSPTFVVGGGAAWNEEYFWARSELWRDEKQRRWLPWRQLVSHTRRRILRPDSDYTFPMIARGMADVIAQGGYGAIGSHGQQHGLASHWEIWMTAAAMGNHGALDVASRHGAYFLGALEDIGTLEVGKLADLVVLNSNPLNDITNTLEMRYVMKGGVLYEADTLDEIWPRQRPFGEYYWVEPDMYRDDVRPIGN